MSLYKQSAQPAASSCEVSIIRCVIQYALSAVAVMLLSTLHLTVVRCRPSHRTVQTNDMPLLEWPKQTNVLDHWEPLDQPVVNVDENDFSTYRWRFQSMKIKSETYHFHKLRLLNNSGTLCNDGSPAGWV